MRVFIPTCETAVCTVPEWHRADVKGHEDLISSADGWSPGALNLAQGIASALHAPLLNADLSRLLIDLSKHPEDADRWSGLSMRLTPEQRLRLDERQKGRYLGDLSQRTNDALKRNQEVIHLSVDTRQEMGEAWIAFSYDSRSSAETEWVREWSANILSRSPLAVIREEGTPTRSLAGYLRERYPSNFASVRLIANQSAFLEGKPVKWAELKKTVTAAIPR